VSGDIIDAEERFFEICHVEATFSNKENHVTKR
jgi:hypothetical protein